MLYHFVFFLLLRLPPRATRTTPLFPSTTVFRSSVLLAPPAMPSTTCSPSRASPPISQPSVSRSSRAALLLASVSPQEPSHWPQREKRSPSALPPVRLRSSSVWRTRPASVTAAATALAWISPESWSKAACACATPIGRAHG